jgi:hypothetical protein
MNPYILYALFRGSLKTPISPFWTSMVRMIMYRQAYIEVTAIVLKSSPMTLGLPHYCFHSQEGRRLVFKWNTRSDIQPRLYFSCGGFIAYHRL